MRLILASKSPRRIELLKKLGQHFEIVPSQSPERTDYKRPAARVKDLAVKKAFDVAKKYPAAVVIGADTLVYCKGEVIGKPKDKKDALRILNKLNGSWQSVYTGVCVMCLEKQKMLFGHDVSKCKARKLSAAELEQMAGKHLDKAGAYAVQDDDDKFIEKIVGSRTNVVGFPVEFFEKLFKEFLAL
ncbi:MAG: Maf family protein [Candidatus Avelusimicrobium sp.]|uniref:Maf family protein n=1 Tax=Candidatus Avelusimicrobium sp. TaxID=3048833 RepID=UPI003EFC2416